MIHHDVARATSVFQGMARNNAWSNDRLLRACAGLSQSELEAPRVGFFPSILRTLSHVLIVDWYYLDGLEGGGRGLALVEREIPFPRLPELAAAQADTDARLVRFCDRLTDETLMRSVALDRGDAGMTQERLHAVLSHLFVHQIHHRGQAHAMLSGTRVPPPQLDEFFLAFDAPRSAEEIARLGLGEPS